LVTFQIQIANSNFQIQNKVLCLPVFVAKHIFKTHQHFCFPCFHSHWHFFWFHKDREITKSLFTLAENNFGERKLSCNCLNFGEITFAGTKRAVPLHLARSCSQSEHRIRRILPSRRACHIIRHWYSAALQTFTFACCTAKSYRIEELPSMLWKHNEITQQMLCWDNNVTTSKEANQSLSSQRQISQPRWTKILVIIFYLH